MTKKKLILLVAISILFFVALFFLIFINYTKERPTPKNDKSNTTTPQKEGVEGFAEKFAKDFSTYDYKNTPEYMKRLQPYIKPEYYAAFKKRFDLPSPERIVPTKKDNYSKYQSSRVIILSKTDSKSTVYVQYAVTKKDAPGRPQEFKDDIAITMVVEKINNEFKISRLDFSTTE